MKKVIITFLVALFTWTAPVFAEESYPPFEPIECIKPNPDVDFPALGPEGYKLKQQVYFQCTILNNNSKAIHNLFLVQIQNHKRIENLESDQKMLLAIINENQGLHAEDMRKTNKMFDAINLMIENYGQHLKVFHGID